MALHNPDNPGAQDSAVKIAPAEASSCLR